MDVEVRGVQHQVGLGPQRLQRLAFSLDHLTEGPLHDVFEGVPTPARLVAPNQDLGAGVEEDELHALDLLSQVPDQHDDLVVVAPGADDEGETVAG